MVGFAALDPDEVGTGLEELGEGGVAVVRLVEGRVEAQHHEFHTSVEDGWPPRSATRSEDRFPQQDAGFLEVGGLEAFGLQIGGRHRFHQEAGVEHELVAGFDPELVGVLPHSDADDALALLADLLGNGDVVAVPADDHDHIQMRVALDVLDDVDGHADVGPVLAETAAREQLDQVHGMLLEARAVGPEETPVGKGLVDVDLAERGHESHDRPDIDLGRLFAVAVLAIPVLPEVEGAERGMDVLEVPIDGHVGSVRGGLWHRFDVHGGEGPQRTHRADPFPGAVSDEP